MLYQGYVRSNYGEEIEKQKKILKKHKQIKEIFIESDGEIIQKLINQKNTCIVICDLSSLATTLNKLEKIVLKMIENNVDLIILKSMINNKPITTKKSDFLIHFLEISKFRSKKHSESVQCGINQALVYGRKGGRVKIHSTEKLNEAAEFFLKNKKISAKKVCDKYNISRATLYRSIRSIKKS